MNSMRNCQFSLSFSLKMKLLILVISLLSAWLITEAQVSQDGILILHFDEDGKSKLYIRLGNGSELPFLPGYSFADEENILDGQPSPDSTILALQIWRGVQVSDLELLNLVTGDAIPITQNSKRDVGRPSWSLDGTRLAYLSEGIDGDFGAVYIYTLATYESQLVTNSLIGKKPDGSVTIIGGIRDVGWSPDGKQIVLSVQTPPEGAQDVLVILNTDGSDPHVIAEKNLSMSLPVWAKSGVIYTVCGYDNDNYESICSIDSQHKTVERLLEINKTVVNERNPKIVSMHLSPSGEIIFDVLSSNAIYMFQPTNKSVTKIKEADVDTALRQVIGFIRIQQNWLPSPHG